MANEDIKKEIKDSGFLLWHIADAFDISDSYFSCLLRRELSPERKTEIRKYLSGQSINKDALKEAKKPHKDPLIDCCVHCGCIVRTHWTVCPGCGERL